MDLPQYDQYSKWFGDGPMATRYGMDQMDLAKQFQNQKLQQEGANLKKTTLANQFDEQNNPQLLEHQGLVNRGLGVDTRIKEGTEALQLDAKQKEFVQKAKQSDLDMMEIQGQRWAYSPDPKQRAQGEEILRMHKDFIKMRDQGKIAEDSQRRLFAQQQALQAQREAAAQRQAAQRAATRGATTAKVSGLTTDKQVAEYMRLAQEAQAQGDNDTAAYYYNWAQNVNQAIATRRPDPGVGKTVISPEGLAPAPTRPAQQLPPAKTPQAAPAAAKPALPAGWVLKN